MSNQTPGIRGLAKSMMSCAWAMSVFGVQAMSKLMLTPGPQVKNVADTLDKVTNATTETFEDSSQTVYRAGASVQNAVIDVVLGGGMLKKPGHKSRNDGAE